MGWLMLLQINHFARFAELNCRRTHTHTNSGTSVASVRDVGQFVCCGWTGAGVRRS